MGDPHNVVTNVPTLGISLSLRLRRSPIVAARTSFAVLSRRGTGDFLVPTPDEVCRRLKGDCNELRQGWEAMLNLVRPTWWHHASNSNRVPIERDRFERHANEIAGGFETMRQFLLRPPRQPST